MKKFISSPKLEVIAEIPPEDQLVEAENLDNSKDQVASTTNNTNSVVSSETTSVETTIQEPSKPNEKEENVVTEAIEGDSFKF